MWTTRSTRRNATNPPRNSSSAPCFCLRIMTDRLSQMRAIPRDPLVIPSSYTLGYENDVPPPVQISEVHYINVTVTASGLVENGTVATLECSAETTSPRWGRNSRPRMERLSTSARISQMSRCSISSVPMFRSRRDEYGTDSCCTNKTVYNGMERKEDLKGCHGSCR